MTNDRNDSGKRQTQVPTPQKSPEEKKDNPFLKALVNDKFVTEDIGPFSNKKD